jgi:hypothetical protein
MKKFMSVILAVVLVTAVGASLANGTFAGFLDTEVSSENLMCAGTRNLQLTGGPFELTHAMPCKSYTEEFLLANAGDLDGKVFLHIPRVDGSYYCGRITWKGIKCEEDGAISGEIYNGEDYVTGSPVGVGRASSESELVSEEGGQVGQIMVTGLGVDAGSDKGKPEYIMSKHIDVQIWFDKNGDGDYNDDGESIYLGPPPVKLADITCDMIELGVIPASPVIKAKKFKSCGWSSYFEYIIGSGPQPVPLVVGQNWVAGEVKVWDDSTNLYVEYNTDRWRMKETHVYVGTTSPPTMAPGQFKEYPPSPNPHLNLPCVKTDSYTIPLPESWTPGTKIYLATHAAGCDGETGWGKGVFRKLKVTLHLQQVSDPAWDGVLNVDYDEDGDVDEDDAQKRWWPTNIFQGDKCTFDMVLWLKKQ